jgi:predicted ATP-binding protein involved in virulence
MFISKIKIKNFKMFENSLFEFDNKFNLIVGINGSGKTSLLKAIAIALGGWTHAYVKSDSTLRPIQDNEFREIEMNDISNRAKQVSIDTVGKALIIDNFQKKNEVKIRWQRLRQEGDESTKTIKGDIQYSNSNTLYNLNIDKIGENIQNFILNGNIFYLPIIAFYEVDRIWKTDNYIDILSSAETQYSRFDPYKDAFHTGLNIDVIGQWLFKYELDSLQNKTESLILDAINKIIAIAVEKASRIKANFLGGGKGRLLIEFEDDRITPFEHLSDGQKTIIALFIDIVRRTVILNSHFGIEAPQKTKGVVLIDEIDLHLHPKWQRTIVSSLIKAFPNIQFFASTHSPFVIGSIEGAKVYILDKNGKVKIEDSKAGYRYSYIADDIFGIENEFDIDTEKDLNRFSELQNELYAFNYFYKDFDFFEHKLEFINLIKKLSSKSEAVSNIIGRELRQLERVTGLTIAENHS